MRRSTSKRDIATTRIACRRGAARAESGRQGAPVADEFLRAERRPAIAQAAVVGQLMLRHAVGEGQLARRKELPGVRGFSVDWDTPEFPCRVCIAGVPMHLMLRPDGRELPGVRGKLHEEFSAPSVGDAAEERRVPRTRRRGVSTAGRTRRLPARSGLALESTRRRMDRPIKISLRDGSCE